MNKDTLKKEEGYYIAKFYNHERLMVLYWNGNGLEMFRGDKRINDEIEWTKPLNLNNYDK